MQAAIDRLAETTDEALVCRDLGHGWPDTVHSFVVTERRGKAILEVGRELTCRRCGSTRTDVYAYPSFELIARHYCYAAHYLALPPRDGEHAEAPTKRDARRSLFSRSGVH